MKLKVNWLLELGEKLFFDKEFIEKLKTIRTFVKNGDFREKKLKVDITWAEPDTKEANNKKFK